MDNKRKEAQGLGMPWEKEYGYAQGVKVGKTVWLSGQLGHDEKGALADGMEAQMQQTYYNISTLLGAFGMTTENVIEEVLYVLDIDAAMAARKKLGREVYKDPMLIASTMIGVVSLAIPGQLVEIRIVAKE
jgi:enamine deaminase RidA (YjgF/YER057c/UK114 family)